MRRAGALAILSTALIAPALTAQQVQTSQTVSDVERRPADRTNIAPRIDQLESMRVELQRALERSLRENAPSSHLDVLRQHISRLEQRIARLRQRVR